MNNLQLNKTYLIELCSGEQHHWQYLGPDPRGAVWWRDRDDDREFCEASLMYAWSILGEAGDASEQV